MRAKNIGIRVNKMQWSLTHTSISGGRGSMFDEHSALQPTTELTMMNSTTRILALFLALGAASCGAASSGSTSNDARRDEQRGSAWTSAQLERLDSELRSRVRERDDG